MCRIVSSDIGAIALSFLFSVGSTVENLPPANMIVKNSSCLTGLKSFSGRGFHELDSLILEGAMQRKLALITIFSFPALFLTGTLASGQSLGDIARANREKQNQANPSATPPAVITTDDLESGSSKSPSPTTSGKSSKVAPTHAGSEQIDPKLAAEWKRKIVAQKSKVQTLQAQIDQLNAQIHPPGGAAFDGPPSRDQAHRIQRVAEIQVQLDEQKRALAEMQEEARSAGMHTAVYDP